MPKIICVCGARPNFMKIAPIMQAFQSSGKFETLLVHTGQHYDENMSKLFFDDLNMPEPDINLEVGPGRPRFSPLLEAPMASAFWADSVRVSRPKVPGFAKSKGYR